MSNDFLDIDFNFSDLVNIRIELIKKMSLYKSTSKRYKFLYNRYEVINSRINLMIKSKNKSKKFILDMSPSKINMVKEK